jgi:TonB family protein
MGIKVSRLLSTIVVLCAGAGCARLPRVVEASAAAPGDAACAALLPGRRDTIVSTIYATTGYDGPAAPAVRRFRAEVLRSIVAFYKAPERISVPALEQAALQPDSSDKGSLISGPLFDGEIAITIGGDGRVAEVRVVGATDGSNIFPSVRDAVLRADSAGDFVTGARAVSDGRLEVRIRVFGTGSQLPAPIDSTAPFIALAEFQLAVWRVDVPTRAIPGSAHPRYPSLLRNRGLSGTVLVQFIVDAGGRADPGSVQTIFASHPDFLRAVVEAMRTMRFNPGLVGGCAAPTWVRQRFDFRIDP